MFLVHDGFVLAHDLGVLIVAGRGNGGDDAVYYPACYPGDWVLSVGAFTSTFERSPFSCYGHGIDVMAPGGLNTNQTPENIYSTSLFDSYYYLSGTSMAAPHVTGLAALLHQFNGFPGYGDNYRQVIIRTTTNMDVPGYDVRTGFGRINAIAALEYIAPPKGTYTCLCRHGSGPYVRSISDFEWYGFQGVPGMNPAHAYLVKVYEVWYTTSYADGDCSNNMPLPRETPITWGQSVYSNGWSGANPQDGVRYCEVVEADWNSITLRSWVYELYDPDDLEPIRFIPHSPELCTFGFSVTMDVTPDPPFSLSVRPSLIYHPFLEWQDSPNSFATHYKIYRIVNGIDPDWVHIATVSASSHPCYEDRQYSTPHDGPIAYWTSLADYTVTACVDEHAESQMPSPVSIKVVTPENPKPPTWKIDGSSEDELNTNLPIEFALLPIYPNPSNAVAIIEYWLPSNSYVKVDIYNISGQNIETLVSGSKDAGKYKVSWDAAAYPSGVYFCRMQTREFNQLGKLMLIK